jgi:hypothetical protein
MIIFVIIINFSITLINLYLAVKIWQLCKRLNLIANKLDNCEILIHSLLSSAPQVLLTAHHNIYHFRQKYQLLQLQLKQIQQIIILLNWLYQAWRKYSLK